MMRQQAGGVYLNPDRERALDNFVEIYEQKFERELIDQQFADWKFFTLETESGAQVGALTVKDSEAHYGILKSYRGKWRMAETIKETCRLFHITKTCIGFDKPRIARAMMRYGWRCTDKNDRGWIFTLENNNGH